MNFYIGCSIILTVYVSAKGSLYTTHIIEDIRYPVIELGIAGQRGEIRNRNFPVSFPASIRNIFKNFKLTACEECELVLNIDFRTHTKCYVEPKYCSRSRCDFIMVSDTGYDKHSRMMYRKGQPLTFNSMTRYVNLDLCIRYNVWKGMMALNISYVIKSKIFEIKNDMSLNSNQITSFASPGYPGPIYQDDDTFTYVIRYGDRKQYTHGYLVLYFEVFDIPANSTLQIISKKNSEEYSEMFTAGKRRPYIISAGSIRIIFKTKGLHRTGYKPTTGFFATIEFNTNPRRIANTRCGGNIHMRPSLEVNYTPTCQDSTMFVDCVWIIGPPSEFSLTKRYNQPVKFTQTALKIESLPYPSEMKWNLTIYKGLYANYRGEHSLITEETRQNHENTYFHIDKGYIRIHLEARCHHTTNLMFSFTYFLDCPSIEMSKYFQCSKHGRDAMCVAPSAKCNGVKDCINNDDEASSLCNQVISTEQPVCYGQLFNCDKSVRKSDGRYATYCSTQRCDQVNDCDNGEDEEYCSSIDPGISYHRSQKWKTIVPITVVIVVVIIVLSIVVSWYIKRKRVMNSLDAMLRSNNEGYGGRSIGRAVAGAAGLSDSTSGPKPAIGLPPPTYESTCDQSTVYEEVRDDNFMKPPAYPDIQFQLQSPQYQVYAEDIPPHSSINRMTSSASTSASSILPASVHRPSRNPPSNRRNHINMVELISNQVLPTAPPIQQEQVNNAGSPQSQASTSSRGVEHITLNTTSTPPPASTPTPISTSPSSAITTPVLSHTPSRSNRRSLSFGEHRAEHTSTSV